MHRLRSSALVVASVLALAGQALAGPEGLYVSLDDKTDQPRALIEIVKLEDGTLNGFARGSFVAGEDVTAACARCKGELQGQPMLGLHILRDLRPSDTSPTRYKGGRITDPDNGQTYKSRAEFSDDYATVKVRGYIGTPALGRSQVWTRATASDIVRANENAAAFGVPPIAVPAPAPQGDTP